MEQHWLTFLKAAMSRIIGLKRYWKAIVEFVSRIAMLNETREARRIENMAKYLDVVSKSLSIMKRNGCPEEVLRRLAVDLNVPLIEANLESMIVARQFAVVHDAPHTACSDKELPLPPGPPPTDNLPTRIRSNSLQPTPVCLPS